MAFLAYNHKTIPTLVFVVLLVTPQTLSFQLDPMIDPDTKHFIRTICNPTRNPKTCETMFTSNLLDPDTDPEAMTRIAIDLALEVIDKHLGYTEGEKGKLYDQKSSNRSIITGCEEGYLGMKSVLEKSKRKFNIEELRSMVKVGEIFEDIEVHGKYEMGKCANMLVNNYCKFDLDLNLMEGISERNQEIWLVIEMVTSAGKELVKVMDVGADERDNKCCGFLQMLFHG